ncbi:MAG: isoprenylcysteine carboxylmethyltransferase family protein [Luteimonas sp.]
MASLDLKVPPPVIVGLCAGLAWVLARSTPGFTDLLPARLAIAAALVLAGVLLALSGLLAFRKIGTTANPHTPGKSNAIVRSGPYRFTRNPMYLGLTLALLGWCAYLANPLTLVAVVMFVTYITRLQIMPEERLLLEKFGEPYAQYIKSVRRWI